MSQLRCIYIYLVLYNFVIIDRHSIDRLSNMFIIHLAAGYWYSEIASHPDGRLNSLFICRRVKDAA